MSLLTLYRSNVVHETRPEKTRRLVVQAPSGLFFAAIENADDPDMMPLGEYELIMATMATSGMRALWLPDTELFGHPANRAYQLDGCWAAGQASREGVVKSIISFEEIFEELGGFEERRRVPFRCVELTANDQSNLRVMLSDETFFE